MALVPAKVRQYTEEEWEAVRPIIEQLYLREHRPLFAVMHVMETNHQFKASVAMYKRRFRMWGLYKISSRRARPPTDARVSARADAKPNDARGRPRYLAQNDIDESTHALLLLLTPWVAQTYVLWEYTSRVNQLHCPPPAQYTYDDFAHSVAVAAAAREAGDVAWGPALRRAFLELERAVAPGTRTVYTLMSLFFATMVLNEVGLFEVSRMLIVHAAKLVRARAQEVAAESDLEEGHEENVYLAGHVSHPFPQILQLLQYLAMKLDDATMATAVCQIWSAYHRTTCVAKAESIFLHASQRQYWADILRKRKNVISASAAAKWLNTRQPVVHYLSRLQGCSERNEGLDSALSLVYLDSIVSLYAFSRHEDFEQKALELLARVKTKRANNVSRQLTHCLNQWECSANLVLTAYYLEKRDLDKVIKHIAAIIPDTTAVGWKAIVTDEYNNWVRETSTSVV